MAELARAMVTELRLSCIDRDIYKDLQLTVNTVQVDDCLPQARYRTVAHRLDSRKPWRQLQLDLIAKLKLAKGEFLADDSSCTNDGTEGQLLSTWPLVETHVKNSC